MVREPPAPLLELEHVTKDFHTGAFGGGRMPAVRDVTMSVARREILAMVGESGSGKTTLARLVLRLTPPTSGRVVFDGADVSRVSGKALRRYYRRVQGVFQDPFSSYNPVFRTDRSLHVLRGEFFPEVPQDEWEARIHSCIESVRLNPSDVLGKFPHQLSGGQLQRLMVARALLLDVELLVADEVTSMLDASTRIDVLNLLGASRDRGLGVLFITHDLALASYISDRTVILRHGRVVEEGPTDVVFGDPTAAYTKALLSSVPRANERWVTES